MSDELEERPHDPGEFAKRRGTRVTAAAAVAIGFAVAVVVGIAVARPGLNQHQEVASTSESASAASSPETTPTRGPGSASTEVRQALRTYAACMRSHGFVGESHPNTPSQAIMSAEEESSPSAVALSYRYRSAWRTCVKPYQQVVDGPELYGSQ